MRDYQTKHGPIPIVDSFDNVRPLTSRDTMLSALGEHGIHLLASEAGGGTAAGVPSHVVCTAPPQLVVHEGAAPCFG